MRVCVCVCVQNKLTLTRNLKSIGALEMTVVRAA